MRTLLKRIFQILDGTPAVYGRKERGQSVLEMAFITPLLIMLVAGIIEIGWYANNYQTLLEVSRVGARRGAILTGDKGPLVWNNAASIMFNKQVPGTSPPEYWTDPSNDATSANFRSACSTLIDSDLGYYNIIVCNMLNSMDPLRLRENGVDDIVVSAFALMTVNNDNPDNWDLSKLPAGTCTDASCETYYNSIFRRTYDFTAFDGAVPPARRIGAGFQSVVVGRYPTNANECTVDTNNNILDYNTGFERDPFDFIADAQNPNWNFSISPDPLPMEIAGADFGTREYQRGFAWFGQHRVDNPNVMCWGSEWDLAEVEALVNLPNFPLTNQQERSYLPPSYGLVIVEIFWQHDLLLQFPFFSPVLNVLGAQPTISVWAAFPAPGAEPNISFWIPPE